MLRYNNPLHIAYDNKILGTYHIGNSRGPNKNVIRFYFKPGINIDTTLKLKTSNNYYELSSLSTQGGLTTSADINILISGNDHSYGCRVTLEKLRGTLTFSAKIHLNKEERIVILDILFDNWEYYWTGGSIIFESSSVGHISNMADGGNKILRDIERYDVIKVDDVSDYFSLLTDHTFEVTYHISQKSEKYYVYNNKNRMVTGPTLSISGVAGYYLNTKSIKIPNNTKFICILSPTYAYSEHDAWSYIYDGNIGYWGPILESNINIPIRIYNKNSDTTSTNDIDMSLVYDGKDNYYHYYHFSTEGVYDNHWILNAYDHDYIHIFPKKKNFVVFIFLIILFHLLYINIIKEVL